MERVEVRADQRAVIDYIQGRVFTLRDEHQRWVQELNQVLCKYASELNLDDTYRWKYEHGAFVKEESK